MATQQITALVSKMILARMDNGLSLQEAIDAVLGIGTFERLTDDLYRELNKEAKTVLLAS